jgi:hypothetical protein
MSTFPVEVPTPDEETRPFWDATRDGVLLLPRCDSCAEVIWFPRSFCPHCGSTDVSWFPASGAGTVYTYTVVRKANGPYRGAVPYVVAYVELAEGPRVLTNIVDCDPADVSIGAAVSLVWQAAEDGTQLYRFRLG